MELDHMLLADEIVERADGKIDIVGAAWDTILAPSVPVHHPQITIVMRFLLTPYEAEHAHRISLVIMGEDGEVIRADGELRGADPELLADWPPTEKLGVGSIVNLQNIQFQAYGTYHVAALWDGTNLRDPIVFKVEPPPPQALQELGIGELE